MSPIPLPTDNLYKFIALTGVTLLITSLVFPLNRLDEIELTAQQTGAKRKVLEIEVSALEVDFFHFRTEVKKLESEVDALSRPASTLKEEVRQAGARFLELEKRRTALAIKRAEVQGNEDEGALLLKQMDRTWSYLKVGGFAGLFMTNIGFLLWYRRVQKPADLAAQKRANARDD